MPSVKALAKTWFEHATGARVYRALPRGVDVISDMARWLPNHAVTVAFDVGANKGQSATEYLEAFPSAHVYSFEPVPSTFELLTACTKGHARAHCFRLAFAATEGTATMLLDSRSTMATLETAPGDAGANTVSTPMTTIDAFCSANAIERIDFLKIDTEGYDLEVLKGGARMLREQRIGLVSVEAGMNPGNTRHVPLETLKNHLEGCGYFMFGVYEQVGEWPTQEPHLRRVNPAFVSKKVIEANRRSKRDRSAQG